jgi:hypothetical protein
MIAAGFGGGALGLRHRDLGWYVRRHGGFGGDAARGLHNLELTGRGLPHETVAGERARGFAVT